MNIVKAKYTVCEKEGHYFKSPADVYEMLKKVFNPLQEEFYILPTVGQETIAHKLFIGGIDAAITDLRVIFHKLLVEYPNCSAFLIAHNHPSGDCDPSGNDVIVTKQIKEAAKLLGYNFLDHIIFSNKGFYSFTDNGIL